MKSKKLSVTEYAKLRDVSRQSVLKAIKESWNLPNVTKIEKFGRFYLLTVKEN